MLRNYLTYAGRGLGVILSVGASIFCGWQLHQRRNSLQTPLPSVYTTFNNLNTIRVWSEPHMRSDTSYLILWAHHTWSLRPFNFSQINIFLPDYMSDDSITKFVSKRHGLIDKNYVPKDLVVLNSEYLHTVGNMELREEAAQALYQLARIFEQSFGKKIGIISAYRSSYYQRFLQQGCPKILCAPVGYSEHQLGLAIDLFVINKYGTKLSNHEFQDYFTWLLHNAHRYGRHNSYQNGAIIEGYQPEPWHWRYVGRELATLLYNEQLTFTQRYIQQTSH